MFMSDMAIIFSLPQAVRGGAGNLKGLSQEREATGKIAETLGAYPFKRDLGINNAFSQNNLAGQSH